MFPQHLPSLELDMPGSTWLFPGAGVGLALHYIIETGRTRVRRSVTTTGPGTTENRTFQTQGRGRGQVM